jgi:transposase-like protein
MPVGRPSTYTPELADEIVSRLAEGEPLAEICRSVGFPHPTTVRQWMEKLPALSLAIASAREDGEDRIAADCLKIADDSTSDYREREDGSEEFNAEHVQRSKLRIETRLKLLAKWNPKKYGDKIQTELSGSVSIGVAETLRARRLRREETPAIESQLSDD